MKTSSTTDDKKIMESVLSGSDTFNLSNENDKAYGYAGDDVFNVGEEMILLTVALEQTS